ncbi:PQQ-binding-like beta-propeller repeat protein [Streptomyces prunicolor]|uniref:outer membrane protein assembly factor BamB family protein n=1 Tax=Streptomyces prunicolor TaxID=67348 RepID=UPI00371C656E
MASYSGLGCAAALITILVGQLTPWWALVLVPLGIFNAIEVIGYFAYLPVVIKPYVLVSAGSADGDSEQGEGQQGGAVRWQLDTGGAVKESSPVVVDGTVYVGSWNHLLWAVDALSGEERWQCRVGGVVAASPAFANGTVYIGSWDKCLWAVDAVSGRERWRVRTNGLVRSTPVVTDGMVLFGSNDGFFRAVDAVSGKSRWQVRVGTGVRSSPTVVGDSVYVGVATTAFCRPCTPPPARCGGN